MTVPQEDPDAEQGGPIVQMQGDGNRLFRALGYYAGQAQGAVRRTLARHAAD